MPLVFVHGVNVRKGPEYADNEAMRDGLFRRFALNKVVDKPALAAIENPYWGQYGATLAFGNASLPSGKHETFGPETIFEEILAEIAPDVWAAQNQVLLTLARRSMVRAVDALWAAGAFSDSGSPVGSALAETAVSALEYAHRNPRPEWLETVPDDDKFVEKMLTELEGNSVTPDVESFGADSLWNHLKTAVRGCKPKP